MVPQQKLLREREEHAVGSPDEDELHLYLAFHAEEVICSGRDWQRYRNNFELVRYR